MHEASRTLWDKKREHLMKKLMSLEQTVRTKVSETYTGINESKNGYCHRTNIVKDENGDLLADSHSILKRWKNYFCQVLNVLALMMLSRLKCIQLSH
jgi:hypothetical protein